MADSLERPEEANTRIAVGGPDSFTFRHIVLLAANAAGVQRIRCAHTAFRSSSPDTLYISLRSSGSLRCWLPTPLACGASSQ